MPQLGRCDVTPDSLVKAAVTGGRGAASVAPPLSPLSPMFARCVHPLPSHVAWLRARVLAALAANATVPPPRPSLVLVRRSALHAQPASDSRSASGSRSWDRGRATRDEAVLGMAQRHAAEHGLELLLHSDAHLPPLWHQLRAFSTAAIVVAPMGAAQVQAGLPAGGGEPQPATGGRSARLWLSRGWGWG